MSYTYDVINLNFNGGIQKSFMQLFLDLNDSISIFEQYPALLHENGCGPFNGIHRTLSEGQEIARKSKF